MSDAEQTPGGEILVYTAEDGGSRIRVLLENETVWLTQAMMAELYDTSIPNINIHIRNILEEKELHAEATIKEYLIVRQEGSRQVQRPVKHYNLDMIIAVGYRVRSPRGTQFRQWATERLREYLVKGFTMDDERLKGGGGLADYFDELLARIREIRASEARVYQRIRSAICQLVVFFRRTWPVGGFRQLESMHSNGTEENPATKAHDLGGKNVLVAETFHYFGSQAIPLPPDLDCLKTGRAYKCRFSPDTISRFLDFMSDTPVGVHAPPTHWLHDDASWMPAQP